MPSRVPRAFTLVKPSDRLLALIKHSRVSLDHGAAIASAEVRPRIYHFYFPPFAAFRVRTGTLISLVDNGSGNAPPGTKTFTMAVPCTTPLGILNFPL